MKEMTLLVWLTQLGLSVALPLAGFVLLALWLHRQFNWGEWIIWVGALIGVISAVSGLYQNLKILSRITKEKKDTPVSYNDHE